MEGKSRSQIKKFIDAKSVLVNGKVKKAGHLVQLGDLITVDAKVDSGEGLLRPAAIDLEVIFEDDQVLVINKPPGVVVHPGAGTKETTLVEGVMHYLDWKENQEGAENERPGLVHRLDKDTTGAILFAKDSRSHEKLAKQFAEKTNTRVYVALLNGQLEKDAQTVVSYLGRDPKNRLRFKAYTTAEVFRENPPEDLACSDKWMETEFGRFPSIIQFKSNEKLRLAISEFKLHQVFWGKFSLVEVVLKTGRTHQIRVHAKQMNAPIIGDIVYNEKNTLPKGLPGHIYATLSNVNRQMLHARILGVEHPGTGKECLWEAEIPVDFKQVLAEISKSLSK